MTVYVLQSIDYHFSPPIGIYTTVELAKAQYPEAIWEQDDDGTWNWRQLTSPWDGSHIQIQPYEVDQNEEVATLPHPYRFFGSVSSQTWGITPSGAFYFRATPTPVFGTPEWEAMEKVIAETKAKKELTATATQVILTPMIAEMIARSEAAEADDGRDWKTRFDKLIKQVTEF